MTPVFENTYGRYFFYVAAASSDRKRITKEDTSTHGKLQVCIFPRVVIQFRNGRLPYARRSGLSSERAAAAVVSTMREEGTEAKGNVLGPRAHGVGAVRDMGPAVPLLKRGEWASQDRDSEA
jgi:hypothetical protein